MVPAGKSSKGVLDSGGEEASLAIGPYGAEQSWGFGAMLTVGFRIMRDNLRLWASLALLQGGLSMIPGIGRIAGVFSLLITVVATSLAIHGEDPGGLTDVWERAKPRLWPLITTNFAVALAILGFSLATGMATYMIGALFGHIVGGIAGVVCGVTSLWYFLHFTLYSGQIAILDGESGVGSLKACKKLIQTRPGDLIGGDAMGMIFLVGGAAMLFQMPLVLMAVALSTLLPSFLSPLVTIALVTIMALFTVFGQITWTLLYLRGRKRVLVELSV
jgi:hypothetical protein